MKGFQKVAKGLSNAEKSGAQKHEIASDLLSLVEEPVLITQNLFLRAHLHF